jgi:ribonuclease Z
MGQVTILGSSSAMPDPVQDNTHLLVKIGQRTILIDAANNPWPHLLKIGMRYDELSDVILTHFHPDHVSGVPQLLVGLWLQGRRKALDVYGLAHTLSRVDTMIDLYNLRNWPEFFEIHFHEVAEEENVILLEDEDVRITATPVRHLIPTIGTRFDFIKEKKSFAYSCDTEPCGQMINLAKNVDLLIHEAAGLSVGHASPAQAGEVAQKSGAKTLFLIHYSTVSQPVEQLLSEARSTYQGAVHLARDMMTLEF